MVLNHGQSELDLTIKFNDDGFDYVAFVTSNVALKCFGWGRVGHLVRDCPNEQADDVRKLECIVEVFNSISSATVNWGKSEALLMGKLERAAPQLAWWVDLEKGWF